MATAPPAWSQADLAQASRHSEPAIASLKATDATLGERTGTVQAIRSALEDVGIEFSDDNGPGVKLRREQARNEGRAATKY